MKQTQIKRNRETQRQKDAKTQTQIKRNRETQVLKYRHR